MCVGDLGDLAPLVCIKYVHLTGSPKITGFVTSKPTNYVPRTKLIWKKKTCIFTSSILPSPLLPIWNTKRVNSSMARIGK